MLSSPLSFFRTTSDHPGCQGKKKPPRQRTTKSLRKNTLFERPTTVLEKSISRFFFGALVVDTFWGWTGRPATHTIYIYICIYIIGCKSVIFVVFSCFSCEIHETLEFHPEKNSVIINSIKRHFNCVNSVKMTRCGTSKPVGQKVSNN